MIEKDILSILNNMSNQMIQQFLDNQKITNKLSYILIELIKILEKNDENNIFSKLDEEVEIIKYDDEILSIDGIQKIYKDDNNNDEDKQNDNISNNSQDDGEDLLNDSFLDINNMSSNNVVDRENIEKNSINEKSNDLEDEKETNVKDKTDEKDNFKISLLIKEIENKLKYSIILINLKLYYKYFVNVIRKIFINNALKLLSKKVIEENE